MKKIVGVLAFLFCLGLSFAADKAEGLWKSIDDEDNEVTAVWQIYEEGGLLFGKMLAVVDCPQDELAEDCKKSYKGFPLSGNVNEMPLVGTPWIFNMKKDSDGNWSGGKIIDPDEGKMYGCVIKYLAKGEKHKKYTAKEPTLAMAGTIGPIQVFQYWLPATQADIDAIVSLYPPKNNR